MALKFSRQRTADALNKLLEYLSQSGAGAKIKIYSGPPPADVATAPSGLLLAVLTCKEGFSLYGAADSTPALGPVATGIEVGGVFAETVAPSELIIGNGTSGWYRLFDSNSNAAFQGTVGGIGSAADMELGSTNFVIGGSVTITGSTVQLTGFV